MVNLSEKSNKQNCKAGKIIRTECTYTVLQETEGIFSV